MYHRYRFLLTLFLFPFFFSSFFLSCQACVRSTIFTYLHSRTCRFTSLFGHTFFIIREEGGGYPSERSGDVDVRNFLKRGPRVCSVRCAHRIARNRYHSLLSFSFIRIPRDRNILRLMNRIDTGAGFALTVD